MKNKEIVKLVYMDIKSIYKRMKRGELTERQALIRVLKICTRFIEIFQDLDL